jgi:AcrR family transcriptional regulator
MKAAAPIKISKKAATPVIAAKPKKAAPSARLAKAAKKLLPAPRAQGSANGSDVTINKQGQSLGRKGHSTRLRLMQATEKLLKTTSPVELTAVSIAKESKTSSATFYMYFDDIKDILAALSEDAGLEMSDALTVLDEPWGFDQLESQSVRLVEAFNRIWDTHREVLRYRNLEADRGDPRFDKLRSDEYVPFIELMAQRMIALCPPDRKMSRGDARAIASVFHGAMERMSMTDPDVVTKNVGIKRLKIAQARVIAQVIAASCSNPTPLPKD